MMVVLVGSGRPAHGQALIPLRGDAYVSASYLYYVGGDHLFSSDAHDGESTRGYVAEGNRWYLGDTYGNTLVGSVDYGLFDRVGVSATFAYVSARYEGYAPVNVAVDDGDYHGTFQDVRLSARYLATSGPLAVTPFLAFTFPTHSYPGVGHAAPGRNLRELQVGVYSVRSLAPLLPRWYAQANGSLGLSESAQGFQPIRGILGLELGVLVNDWLSVRIQSDGLYTWNGRDWISEGTGDGHGVVGDDPVQGSGVDAARHIKVGGGVAAALSWRTFVSAGFLTTVSGANTEDSNLFTLGLGWLYTTPIGSSDVE